MKLSRLYLAAPLFNEREREFNRRLRDFLSCAFSVFLPQEDGLLLSDLVSQGVDVADAKSLIFNKDIEAMRECDIVLAVLDGGHVDEGVAFELGFMYALGKRCFALQTDVRRSLVSGNNPMIEMSVERVFDSEQSLLQWCESL